MTDVTVITESARRAAFGRTARLEIGVLAERVLERRFRELGGEAFFGAPPQKTAGVIWDFPSGAALVFNPRLSQAFEVHGSIAAKWRALGAMAFGLPETDELTTPNGVGRFNHFEGGKSIYWTPETGAQAVWGEIRRKWAALGWETSGLGFPVTDETGTPDAVGRFNRFQGGMIYWTPATGAQAVWGDILLRWSELGFERSYLGYPVTDETEFSEGGRASLFQNGGIYWWGDTGPIDLKGVVIHYTGLHAFGETDHDQGSGSDEPYVLMSVGTPDGLSTSRSRVYSDVDGGETRPDLLEIYRGPPFGATIGVVVMENDHGDPEKTRQAVQDVAMGVHKAGVEALKLIPVVGAAVAAVADPLLGSLMPALGGALNDAFGFADDRIGSAEIVLSGRRMVLLAARTANSEFNGIGFKVETPLISGHGASYKAYLGLVPA